MLRAHQASLDICAGVAGALTRVAVSARGATAVATRGGSRQVIRVLHATAAVRSNPGDELLLAYLRLMDACAAGGGEAADILRRQASCEENTGLSPLFNFSTHLISCRASWMPSLRA